MESSMSYRNWSIRNKVLVPSFLLMLVAAVLANNYVSSQQSKEGIASAKRTALAISKQIATDRIVYTDQVMKNC